MPTVIDGSAVSVGGWRSRRSARRLADHAGRSALEDSHQSPADVDLLVNAGLYHERNLGEPALAPLIQEDIGANPSDPFPGGAGTFSFDVANGTAGVLTALQVVDGFLRAGTITTALIVASDADPGHGLAPGFPIRPAGGALVCHWSTEPVGLGACRWCNRPDGGAGFRATVGRRGGRNLLVVEQATDYPERLLAAAEEAVGAALGAEQVRPDAVDVVMVAPGFPAVVTGLARRTGLDPDRFVAADDGLHTVAAIAAIDRARRSGRLVPGTTALLMTAGAGVTAGAAVYRF